MTWSKLYEYVLPLGIIGCLLVFLVPLPAGLMDVLLAANIAVGLVVLLTTLYVRTPLEFSVFPTVLLATTLARLVLNVATTRLILTKADTVGLSAAGEVIKQFGQYVSGDRLVVGFVIFAIIFVIQMLVITKGATRISEVAARFSLDGIPGRQLAIDADLNAGLIDQSEAQRRRERLTRQADFYGAMDGASKFVRGDAVAGVIITLINIVGGLAIGLTQGTMTLAQAADVYTKLTIGDGLASQIPALLISLAAGLLVTRGSESTNLPVEFLKQLFSNPQVMGIAAAFLALLVFTKLPAIPLLVLASVFVMLTYFGRSNSDSKEAATPASPAERKRGSSKSDAEPQLAPLIQKDVLEVELGRSLVNLASGGNLLNKIRGTRERIARDLGLILPSVRVRDNLALGENQYVIRFAGNTVAQEHVQLNGVVVIPPVGWKPRSLPGAVKFSHPAFDARARMLPIERVGEAKASGCLIVSTADLITQHLETVVHQLAPELLTRDATQRMIDELKKTSPAVVSELIPGVMKLGTVQHVLQGLLREGIPIRQLSMILESLADCAEESNNVTTLVERVRQRLARTISARYSSADGTLHVVTLDPRLEDRMLVAARQRIDDPLSANDRQSFQEILKRMLNRLLDENRTPILMTKRDLRLVVRQLAKTVMPNIVVLAQDEVTSEAEIRTVGIVGVN